MGRGPTMDRRWWAWFGTSKFPATQPFFKTIFCPQAELFYYRKIEEN